IPPEFRSPLTIAWEPVSGARTYGYSIVRRSPDRSQRYIAGNQGPNPTWTVELPPTKPGETYVLDLHAYGKSGQVGIFEVQGAGWRGNQRFACLLVQIACLLGLAALAVRPA